MSVALSEFVPQIEPVLTDLLTDWGVLGRQASLEGRGAELDAVIGQVHGVRRLLGGACLDVQTLLDRLTYLRAQVRD